MCATPLEWAWDLFKQKLLPIPATQEKYNFTIHVDAHAF